MRGDEVCCGGARCDWAKLVKLSWSLLPACGRPQAGGAVLCTLYLLDTLLSDVTTWLISSQQSTTRLVPDLKLLPSICALDLLL